MTKLGRTHETLVEADQPRLPVVVENQNRLDHLCRPRFFQRRQLPQSISFRHNTATSAGCAAERGPRKRASAPKGPLREESGFPAPVRESSREGGGLVGVGPVRTPASPRLASGCHSGPGQGANPGLRRSSRPTACRRVPGRSTSEKQIPKQKLPKAAESSRALRRRGGGNLPVPPSARKVQSYLPCHTCRMVRSVEVSANSATVRLGNVWLIFLFPCYIQCCSELHKRLLVQKGRFSVVGSEWWN